MHPSKCLVQVVLCDTTARDAYSLVVWWNLPVAHVEMWPCLLSRRHYCWRPPLARARTPDRCQLGGVAGGYSGAPPHPSHVTGPSPTGWQARQNVDGSLNRDRRRRVLVRDARL